MSFLWALARGAWIYMNFNRNVIYLDAQEKACNAICILLR
jgi:hypothetical protein